MNIEITKTFDGSFDSLNNFCGLTDENFVVLKNSGVVIARFDQPRSFRAIDKFVPLSSLDMYKLLDDGVKISANMPKRETEFEKFIALVQVEYPLAMNNDYPIFEKINYFTGNLTVLLDLTKCYSEEFKIGDFIFTLSKHGRSISNSMDVSMNNVDNQNPYMKFTKFQISNGIETVVRDYWYIGSNFISSTFDKFIIPPPIDTDAMQFDIIFEVECGAIVKK